MPRDGTMTRTRIMDAAEALVLERGFAGTPIDEVLSQAGVTKGAFFHHFGSKQELAHALIARFVELDLGNLESKMGRAEKLHRDPLQQLLIFVGLFLEDAELLAEPSTGCLMASYVYEAGMFDDHVLAVVHDNVLIWRKRLLAKLEEAAAAHPPRVHVDLESLADMATVVFEGAFVVSKIVADPAVLAAQLEHFRNYIELVFSDPR